MTRLRLLTFALLPYLAVGQVFGEQPPAEPPRPNAVAHVSRDVLEHFMQMAVDRTVAIQDNVLGTSVRGSARTQAKITPVLVPDPRKGKIEIRLSGTTYSPRMVGQNGPATIYSSAVSQLDVRKPVILDERGIRLMPAVANVATRLNIQDVTAPRRIVERIARRRAYRSEGAAQSVTTQRTKSRIQAEVDRDAAKPLAQGQDYFERGFRKPLAERGALPKLMHFSSTNSLLQLVMQQCSQTNLPQPEWVPQLNEEHDIALALHENSIMSAYEVFFGGQVAHDRDMLHTVHLLTGEDPRPLRVHARAPRWSMKFAERLPLRLRFDDRSATITLHLTEVTQGENRYAGEFTVSTTYDLQITPNGPRLLRQGELEFDGTSASTGELASALAILQRKFSAIFPPDLMFHGLVPPTGGIWDKVRQLNLEHLDAKGGWVIIGYKLMEPPLVATRP